MARVEWDTASADEALHRISKDALEFYARKVEDAARGIMPRLTGRVLAELHRTAAEDLDGEYIDVKTAFYIKYLSGYGEPTRARHIRKPTRGLPDAVKLVAHTSGGW